MEEKEILENIENTDNKKSNDKKKKTVIAAVVIAVVVIAAVLALILAKGGDKPKDNAAVTEVSAVTDENGEVLTNEAGEVVTEIVTETASAPSGSGTAATTQSSGSSGNTNTIKKPDAPKNISGFKIGEVTENSIELSWNKTDCDGYQIYYSLVGTNGTWSYLEKAYTGNTYTVKNLDAYTDYYFCVRAYNSNAAGTSTSEWTEVLSAKTKALEKARKITFTVRLPMDSNKDETLTLWIGNEKVYEGTVKMNGETVSFETEKEYKGVVKAWVEIKGEGVSLNKDTGSASVEFDASAIGIDIIDGGSLD